MGRNHIPTFESDLSEPSNNPWKGKLPKRPARISVAMPPDDWLCQKLEKLNTVVAEGYPSRAQDSAGLKKDQFVKVPKLQNRWYQMHMIRPKGPHRPGKSLFSWHNSEAKVNSQFPRIVKAAAYPSTGPPSRPISQEYLCWWETCARENSYIVNHAAGFNRCTSQLQERMTAHINLLSSRINKGKAPKEVSAAVSELKDLTAFCQNVSVAMGTALQHLVDSLFVQMSNLILLRRDSSLDHVKNGIKPDTYNQLRNAPLFGHGLFPDAVIRTAEQDIASHHSSGSVPRPGPGAAQQTGWRSSHRYRPYESRENRNTGTGDQERHFGESLAGIEDGVVAEDVAPIPVSLSQEATSNINDNYLVFPTLSKTVVAKLDERTVTRTVKPKVVDSSVLDLHKVQMTSRLNPQSVSCLAVDHAHSVCSHGQPQKKGISPCIQKIEIKDVKGVSCASQCLFAPHVPNVPSVVPSLAVGGRLQKFWQVWLTLGANPRVVSILREGYTLPFKIRPPLTRSPVIKNGYAHPGKSKALFQALIELINKLVVEKVVIRSSLAFYNRLFLVPKPNNRWRPILDLSQLNLFLKPGTFKMETPETIRLSLQRGEWVTSLDFSDAYFHIPIGQRSRKYLRFFLGKKAYQFTALPFGLATAPLEFTKVVKEVKPGTFKIAVCLPSSLPSQSCCVKACGSGLSQDDPGRHRVAQHALVLGSGQSVESDSFQSSLGEGPVNPAIQWSPPQEPESSKSACLAPRASSIQKQGFSDEVAARIEAPQRSSTRAVYKSKWAIFVKWCQSNEVDFRSPSLKQVADFLLYLFKERHLQPSTIEGYRTAIADMIGNDKIQFGKDENLTRLLDSFHRDKPKGRRGVPAWNLSLVLHQLTKAPFEPM